MKTVILVLFYAGFPALVIYLGHKTSLVKKIGAVVICYIAGIVSGNVNVFSTSAARLQDIMTMTTIPLALPLMFFSLDLGRWLKVGKRAFLAFLLQIAAVAMVSSVGFLLFRKGLGADAWKIAGMLAGVYTGGTVNLTSVGIALKADPTLYVAAHASDIVISALYLFFVVTAGQRVMAAILPPFRMEENRGKGGETRRKGREKNAGRYERRMTELQDYESYRGIFSRGILVPLLGAFGLAALIAAIGGGISFLLPKEWGSVTAILVFTTCGILCSSLRTVRRIRMTYQLGQYFILVFSLVIGSMADLRKFATAAPSVVGYVALAVFGSLIVQSLLAALLRIDRDTLLVTSTAGICSPPFVPMVAAALNNREVLFSGIITGIVGWVIGTYFGIGLAFLLRGLGP